MYLCWCLIHQIFQWSHQTRPGKVIERCCPEIMKVKCNSLRWRHNGRDAVSNHHPHDCLLNRLFRRKSKITSKLCVTGFVRGIHRWPVNSQHNRPVTRKNVSIWWRHHVVWGEHWIWWYKIGELGRQGGRRTQTSNAVIWVFCQAEQNIEQTVELIWGTPTLIWMRIEADPANQAIRAPSQCKDVVLPESYRNICYEYYLYNRNSCTGKTTYLYWDGPWFYDRLIFIMEILILVRRHLYIKPGPCLTQSGQLHPRSR